VTQTFSLAAANDYFTIDLLANFRADGGTQQAATIVRTHLLDSVTSVVDAGDNFAMGLIRGQRTDEGANIAGAPVPDLDPYEDWLLWQWRFASHARTGVDGTGVYSEHGATNTLVVDSKAQRKLEELNMSYNLVIKQLAAGAFPAVHQVTGRVLLLLP
jgi:hypothetical protein